MDLRVLGPVEALDDHGESIAMPPKVRTLLAVLLLHVNARISNDMLRDLLWDGESRAMATIYGYVSTLRNVLARLGPEVELRREDGYLMLVVPRPEVVDLHRFAEWVAAADIATDDETALAALVAAIGEFRGEPLDGLRDGAYVRLDAKRTGLVNRWRDACKRHVRVLLALDRHEEAIARLDEHRDRWPADAPFYQLWADAMIAAGRHGEVVADFPRWDGRHGASDELRRHVLRPQSTPRQPDGDGQPSPSSDLLEPDFVLEAKPLPSVLLQSEYRVVDFEQVGDHLPRLRAWLDSALPLDVRLITGPGGLGKTRIAHELVLLARERRWAAGFVRQDAPDGALDRLVRESAPVLLVVDYAEGRAAEVIAILKAVFDRVGEHGPVRVLLVARAAGPWLDDIRRQKDARISSLLTRMLVEALPPLASGDGARSYRFERAARAFAKHLDDVTVDAITIPPDLEDHRYDRMLDVHAAALAAVLDTSVRHPTAVRENPLARVQHHEERYWLASVDAYALPEPHLARLRALVSAATLCGADEPRGARRLIARLPTLDRVGADVVSRYQVWLGDLYPGPSSLNPLRPDRLGEDLVAATLEADPDISAALATEVDEVQLGRALTVLSRAVIRHDAMRVHMVALVEPDLVRRVPVGMAVAGQVGSAELAEVLTGLTGDDPDLIEAIMDGLPKSSLVLSVMAASETKALLHHLLGQDPVDAEYVAEVRHNLAFRLFAVGAFDDALSLAGEAVAEYRVLAMASPDDEIGLATALSTLSTAYTNLGMHDEALAVATESLEVLDTAIAEAHPELTYGPEELVHRRSTSLVNRGNLLLATGSPHAAAAEVELGIAAVLSLLDAEGPEVRHDWHAEFASGLISLGDAYSRLERYPDSYDVCLQAVDVFRGLDAVAPDQYRVDLVRALSNAAAAHGELGRPPEEDVFAAEAISLARALVARHGRVHEVLLADALSNSSVHLRRSGRPDIALAYAVEAVGRYRSLSTASPGEHLVGLADVLYNLGITLREAGRAEEAAEACEESVDIFRKLAGPRPDAFEPALAEALTELAEARSEMNKHRTAFDLAKEAIAIFSLAVDSERRVVRLGLANALHVASIAAFDLGDLDTAVVDGLHAADVYCGLVGGAGPDLRTGYSKVLFSVCRTLTAAEWFERGSAVYGELITVLRVLVEDAVRQNGHAVDERDDLAAALLNAGYCAANDRDHAAAVRLTREAVEIRRELLGSDDESVDYLAEALTNLAVLLCDGDDHEGAVPLAAEAVALVVGLAEDDPEEPPSILVSAMVAHACALGATSQEEAVRVLVEAWEVSGDHEEARAEVRDALRELGPRRRVRRMWQASTDRPFPE